MRILTTMLTLSIMSWLQGMEQAGAFLIQLRQALTDIETNSVILQATSAQAQANIDGNLLCLDGPFLATERAWWNTVFEYCDQLTAIINNNTGSFTLLFLQKCIETIVSCRQMHDRWTTNFARLWHTHPQSPRRQTLQAQRAAEKQRQLYGILTVIDETTIDEEITEEET